MSLVRIVVRLVLVGLSPTQEHWSIRFGKVSSVRLGYKALLAKPRLKSSISNRTCSSVFIVSVLYNLAKFLIQDC